MTCPTATAAVQSAELVQAEESLLSVDVRLVMPFPGLVEGAPSPEEILAELRDALESDGVLAFLELCHETDSDPVEEIGDLQLFDGQAARG